MSIDLKALLRHWKHGRVSYNLLVFSIIVAAILAFGQGLFELFSPGLCFSQSLSTINSLWYTAVLLTFIGIVVTSEAIWIVFAGPKKYEIALLAALKMIVKSCDLDAAANLRAAIYVADKRKKDDAYTLYQEFPYVYDHESENAYGMGRLGLNESIGIVGYLFRRKNEYSMHTYIDNSDSEQFVQKLISDPWNFPESQARKINLSRSSYMVFRFSIPSKTGKYSLDGIIYFDAKGDSAKFDDDLVARILDIQLDPLLIYLGACYGRGVDHE